MNKYFRNINYRNFAVALVGAFLLLTQSALSSNTEAQVEQRVAAFTNHMADAERYEGEGKLAEAESSLSQAIAIVFDITDAKESPALVNTVIAALSDEGEVDRLGSFSPNELTSYNSVVGFLQVASAQLGALQKLSSNSEYALKFADARKSGNLDAMKEYDAIIQKSREVASLETGKVMARLIALRGESPDLPSAGDVGNAQVNIAAVANELLKAQGQYNAVLANVAVIMGNNADSVQATAEIEKLAVNDKLLSAEELLQILKAETDLFE